MAALGVRQKARIAGVGGAEERTEEGVDLRRARDLADHPDGVQGSLAQVVLEAQGWGRMDQMGLR